MVALQGVLRSATKGDTRPKEAPVGARVSKGNSKSTLWERALDPEFVQPQLNSSTPPIETKYKKRDGSPFSAI